MAKLLPFLTKKGPFLIFDKKAKQTFFYIYKLKVSWKKSEKSDMSLWNYEQKTLILDKNGQILAVFSQKRANFEFPTKSETTIFYIYKAKASWEKSEKSDASLWKYEQQTRILGYFGPFLAKKGPILNFRPKNETGTF